MSYVLVPWDFTALKPEQQSNAFKVWCASIMNELAALGKKAVLKFAPLGDTGPASELVTQKADVWVGDLPVSVGILFNDMLDTDAPNQSHPEMKRNFPQWKAANIVEVAERQAADFAAGNLGLIDVLPLPENPDIAV